MKLRIARGEGVRQTLQTTLGWHLLIIDDHIITVCMRPDLGSVVSPVGHDALAPEGVGLPQVVEREGGGGGGSEGGVVGRVVA